MFSHVSTSLVVSRSSKERTWHFYFLEGGLHEFCGQTFRLRCQDTTTHSSSSSGPNALLTQVLPPLFHWLLSLPPILLSPHSASPFMSSCLCPHLLPTQGLKTFLVWTVHVLLSSVPLGKHPSQILLGRSDYAVGHLASHMPRSCWHHPHPGSLGPDTLEGL